MKTKTFLTYFFGGFSLLFLTFGFARINSTFALIFLGVILGIIALTQTVDVKRENR